MCEILERRVASVLSVLSVASVAGLAARVSDCCSGSGCWALVVGDHWLAIVGMFERTKMTMLVTVVATVFWGVWMDRSAPYFPIEISRTATGPISANVLRGGVGVGTVVLAYEWMALAGRPWMVWVPWSGIVLLAVFDDASAWGLHMLGVAIMGAGGVMLVMCRDKEVSRRDRMLVAGAGLAYVLRIVSKGVGLIVLDREVSGGWDRVVSRIVDDPLSAVAVLEELKARGLEIMFHGLDASPPPSPLLLSVFQAGGLFQWLAFFLLALTI